MKKLFLVASILLACTCAQAETTVIETYPDDTLIIKPKSRDNKPTLEFVGVGSNWATVVSSHSCNRDDLKKALGLADKYLPGQQEQDHGSYWTATLVDPFHSSAIQEKESDKLRKQADELDQKDKDLQFIQNVINDKCD